jgi:L-lactate dehydrogenase complex protein LldG
MSTSTSREAILSRVRGALAGIPRRATLPDWNIELAEARKLVGDRTPAEVFAERIRLVSGRAYSDVPTLVEALRAGGWMHGYCDPVLWPELAPFFGPEFKVETEYDRTRIDDYSFGITRALGAVGETGSIILDDAATSRRLAALTPWVHIAVVQRATIHPFLADAVTHLPKDPNIILVTGPSKTADVEGILIEGVHGPGQQWALLV